MIRWPIGTSAEDRVAMSGLPGAWVCSNSFNNVYTIQGAASATRHTGIDLNLNVPNWNDDWHAAVYAIADGIVTFAGNRGGTWGNVIIIQHIDYDGTRYYSRAAHVESPLVKTVDWVRGGDQIASVGDANGYYAYGGAHLHFDLSATDLLLKSPGAWPGLNESLLLANFVDPITFIVRRKHMIDNPDTAAAMRAALAALPKGTPVTILPALPPDREPLGTQLAYIVAVEDVLATAEPPAPRATLTKYVTGSPSMNVRPIPATTQAPVGTLAYQTAVTVYADQPDPAWWQIAATNAPFPGDYLSAQWLSDSRP